MSTCNNWHDLLQQPEGHGTQHPPHHGPLFCVAQMRLQQRQHLHLFPQHVLAKCATHHFHRSGELLCQLGGFGCTPPNSQRGVCSMNASANTMYYLMIVFEKRMARRARRNLPLTFVISELNSYRTFSDHSVTDFPPIVPCLGNPEPTSNFY